MSCKHETFISTVKVARLTNIVGGEITSYHADVKINCDQCGLPFEFMGLLNGYSPTVPMVSFDRTELRAPITPSTDPVEQVKAMI